MFKEVGMKISFLVVMILLVGTIGTGVGFAEFSSPFREADASSSAEAQFVATVSGTSVDFDWSAMVAANSYTMAVALADAYGDVDMSSLAFLEMGGRKTFSTSGLPSGTIFYAAILVNADQRQVVSNTIQFMPFAGIVTFPTNGSVLMQIDDPGGIGTITVSGTVNAAEDAMTISQISGNAGFGPFVLTVADDKPTSYTRGDLTMHFTYAGDGSVVVQSVRSSMRSEGNLSDCQQTVLDNLSDLTARYIAESKGLEGVFHMLRLITNSFNSSDELFRKLSHLSQIYYSALEGVRDKFIEDKAAFDNEYEACSEEPDPDPDPDNPVITIDTSCSIPQGAEYQEILYDDGLPHYEFYLLNGNFVGPHKTYSIKGDGSIYLSKKECLNVDGRNMGWQIFYHENENVKTATHYENGVKSGHDYGYYEEGTLRSDLTWTNGKLTYSIIYNEDGSLKMYCDAGGDGIWHFVDP